MALSNISKGHDHFALKVVVTAIVVSGALTAIVLMSLALMVQGGHSLPPGLNSLGNTILSGLGRAGPGSILFIAGFLLVATPLIVHYSKYNFRKRVKLLLLDKQRNILGEIKLSPTMTLTEVAKQLGGELTTNNQLYFFFANGKEEPLCVTCGPLPKQRMWDVMTQFYDKPLWGIYLGSSLPQAASQPTPVPSTGTLLKNVPCQVANSSTSFILTFPDSWTIGKLKALIREKREVQDIVFMFEDGSGYITTTTRRRQGLSKFPDDAKKVSDILQGKKLISLLLDTPFSFRLSANDGYFS